MTKRIESGAVQLDADVCNHIEPPARGCHAGVGPHIAIPADWATRILAGQHVPGCTYYALDGDALTVADIAIARLGVPAIVNSLPAGPIRGHAAALIAKLAQAPLQQVAESVKM